MKTKLRCERRAAGARLAALALLSPLCLAAAVPQGAPEPDPAVQAAIGEALRAESREERDAALERLRSLTTDPGDIVLQLFLYSRDATSTRAAMAFPVLVDALALRDALVVRSLAPLLDEADPELRRSVGGFLAEYEAREVDRPPSFAVYRPIVDEALRQGREPPRGLVRYLYETDPGQALLLLLRAHESSPSELRPVLWAEHVVSDVLWRHRYGFLPPDQVLPEAKQELERLARDARWWARLYAAHVAREHPAFRAAVPLELLREDEHPLVREAMAWEEEKVGKVDGGPSLARPGAREDVFCAVLRELSDAKRWVVVQDPISPREEVAIRDRLEGLAPEGFSEAWRDLLARSDRAGAGAGSLATVCPELVVATVAEDTLEEIFRQGRWAEFRLRFPGAHGYFRASPVGWSSGGERAVVYVVTLEDRLHGGGHVVGLERDEDGWRVLEVKGVWLS